VEEIEKQLNDSKSEANALRQRLSEVELENKALKIQISKLGSALRQDPEIIERLKKVAKTSITEPAPTRNHTSKKLTTFSATLFIVLFSFGLFFNFGGREPIPMYNTGRTLKSVSAENGAMLPYMISFAPGPVQDVLYSLYDEYLEDPPLEDPLDEFGSNEYNLAKLPEERVVELVERAEEQRVDMKSEYVNESVIVEPTNIKNEL
jgi:regulator of replication initiation timing